MTVYIDPPTWPGHGRMWSHLVSDVSYEELHAFAAGIGCPPRAFERDHYDVPSHRYADAVGAGAVEIGSKELVRRLTAAGLRRPKGRPAARPAQADRADRADRGSAAADGGRAAPGRGGSAGDGAAPGGGRR